MEISMCKNAKAAIVTGASSGIGWAVSRTLCEMGYQVFGIGRDFSAHAGEEGIEHFHPIVCDLLNTEQLIAQIKEIRAGSRVEILINNAGIGYYGLHEELNLYKIQKMVRTNLEVPMILTNLLLRDLKKNEGNIINISSVTAQKSNPHGCAYGATKAGLSSFSQSLFDEARKYGVRVTAIQPDMTKTNLYRHADFKEADAPDTYLAPEEVAEAVRFILSRRKGSNITELTLTPQKHRIARK